MEEAARRSDGVRGGGGTGSGERGVARGGEGRGARMEEDGTCKLIKSRWPFEFNYSFMLVVLLVLLHCCCCFLQH